MLQKSISFTFICAAFHHEIPDSRRFEMDFQEVRWLASSSIE
jgi:hypothetical protein